MCTALNFITAYPISETICRSRQKRQIISLGVYWQIHEAKNIFPTQLFVVHLEVNEIRLASVLRVIMLENSLPNLRGDDKGN